MTPAQFAEFANLLLWAAMLAGALGAVAIDVVGMLAHACADYFYTRARRKREAAFSAEWGQLLADEDGRHG